MNMKKWFIRSEDLVNIDEFYFLSIDADRMNEIETDEKMNFWKYRSIVELNEILRFSLETFVVLHTENELMAAARYAWLLHWLGYERIRILIGPVDPSWKCSSSFLRRSAAFSFRPEVRIISSDLFNEFHSSRTTFVDVRTYEEYSGKISWENLENLIDLMKTRKFYQRLTCQRIVFMCGTGWRASLAAIFADVLELAEIITVLDSGWFEWSERYQNECKPVKNEIFGSDFEA